MPAINELLSSQAPKGIGQGICNIELLLRACIAFFCLRFLQVPFAHPLAVARQTEQWPDVVAVCGSGIALVDPQAFTQTLSSLGGSLGSRRTGQQLGDSANRAPVFGFTRLI